VDIIRFSIDPARQEEKPLLRLGRPCSCGCTGYPFVSLSDGDTRLTVYFGSEREFETFKKAVGQLDFQSDGYIDFHPRLDTD